MAPIKTYSVRYLSRDGRQLGYVYARSPRDAAKQAKQMFGPAAVAIPTINSRGDI